MNNESVVLTIVTVNRDNAANLPRTLESLKQMRGTSAVECLFIDGASTDNSIVIAREFYEPTNIISEPDTGIFNAMNKGLFMAKGRYVLWLNSGDELQPLISGQLLEILRSESADLLCFACEERDQDSSRTIRVAEYIDGDFPAKILHHQATFFLRETVLKVGGYDEKYRISGDRELMFRMHAGGKRFKYFPLATSVFYLGGISHGHNSDKENFEIDMKYGLVSPAVYYWRNLRNRYESVLGPLKRALIGGK